MSKSQLSILQREFFKALKREESKISSQISPIGKLSESECVEIYANGYAARLVEALGETFEATWWSLGDDDFFALAKAYVTQNISQSFDLSDYGEGFPEFLEQHRSKHEIDFASDLARFEWSFKCIFHKPNLVQRHDLFSRLQPDGSDKLVLSQSARLFESLFSVYEIWKRRGHSASEMAEIDWSNPERLLLYRRDSKVFVHSFGEPEFVLLKELASGKTIAEAITIASDRVHLSPEQVQSTFSQIGSLGAYLIDYE